MKDPKEIVLEMLVATKDAYVEIVKDCKGFYHGTRCKESIELIRLLITIYMLLGEQNNEHDEDN